MRIEIYWDTQSPEGDFVCGQGFRRTLFLGPPFPWRSGLDGDPVIAVVGPARTWNHRAVFYRAKYLGDRVEIESSVNPRNWTFLVRGIMKGVTVEWLFGPEPQLPVPAL
jgi:hypothetical protein